MMENAAISIVAATDEAPQFQTEAAWMERRGCRALWAAVLLRAYDDYWGRLTNWGERRTQQRYIHDARQWFESDQKNVCSFLFVCEALGLDPGKVRERVAAGPRRVFMEDDFNES